MRCLGSFLIVSSLYVRKVLMGSLSLFAFLFLFVRGWWFVSSCIWTVTLSRSMLLSPAPTWATVFPFVNVCLVQYFLLRWSGPVYYRRHCYWGQYFVSILFHSSFFVLHNSTYLGVGTGWTGLGTVCYGTVGMDLNVFFFFSFSRGLRYVQPTTQESSVFLSFFYIFFISLIAFFSILPLFFFPSSPAPPVIFGLFGDGGCVVCTLGSFIWSCTC